MNLGQLVGALMGGYSGAVHGPRLSVLATSLAQIGGWVAIAVAPNITWLCLGRVLGRDADVNRLFVCFLKFHAHLIKRKCHG